MSESGGWARHEHRWEVEYLPDPMSGGAVIHSGALVCATCYAEVEDK